jgi:hypothetical protein
MHESSAARSIDPSAGCEDRVGQGGTRSAANFGNFGNFGNVWGIGAPRRVAHMVP